MSLATKQAEKSETPRSTPSISRGKMIGLITGLGAAVGYTLANIALRQMAKPADFDWAIWVTANKAIPATLLTWGLVLYNHSRGRQGFPPGKLILPLILTGLSMQFGGNLTFQWSLGLIGLAMTVPIVFALLLISGAVVSRIYLGEPITPRTLLALTILMVAVTILSLGAGEASRSIVQDATASQFMLGIAVAMVSGIAYGVCGVVIRKNVRNLPVSASLFLISTTGVVAMGALSLYRIPLEELLATTPLEYQTMMIAGVCNAVAFYAIGVSYRFLNVTQVNMLNTSQIAMATLAGVLFFMEPVTPWLMVGVCMTAFGLFMIDRQ